MLVCCDNVNLFFLLIEKWLYVKWIIENENTEKMLCIDSTSSSSASYRYGACSRIVYLLAVHCQDQ